jgi:Holliday junction resolvasome RuvABC endonuclease subunit
MNILAIDPGNQGGLAFCSQESGIVSEPFSVKDSLTWDQKAGRFVEAAQRLIFGLPGGLDLVAIEMQYTKAERSLAVMLQRYVGLAAYIAWEEGSDFIEVPISSWKAALGNGRMNQAQYVKAVKTVMGIEVETHGEAAALGVLNWAMRRYK